ncbi:LACT-domain-containing protein [Fistulina hepatica ATCC 64428]|uniref:LACT-domain-containing protein n=1 Tax=Fistulina hepatica ATCC 64428 TaxID=1128425 RepID=A0A0D7AGQ5_9AGAR|nr:LACT-domain-containing protein [Fistulina hepatica ATCC 64428]
MALRRRTKSTSKSDKASASGQTSESKSTAAGSQSSEIVHLKDEVKSLKAGTRKPRYERYVARKFIFPLGIFVGFLVGALLFVHNADIEDMHSQLLVLLSEYDISMPQFPGLDLSAVETEWLRLKNNIPQVWKLNNDGREFQVGEQMKLRGLSTQHPVVLIPADHASVQGLESWSTAPEYRPFFRERLWGGFNMITQVTFNREKWLAAIMLDPVTGLDVADTKVRAVQGIDAASSFIQGYWIWSKIIENLAAVDYDTNNLYMAAYDWRLAFYNLEVRDGYFSRLKSTIEDFKRRFGQKTVLTAHSMGANAKAMAAFLSGEMKDTVQMNPAGAYVLEQFFSRKERQDLFRSWAGSASMWIKGGDSVWGNLTWAPDDILGNSTYSHGQLISFRHQDPDESVKNMTSQEAGQWILEHAPSTFQKMFATNYSNGIERDKAILARNDKDHTKWSNPLEIRLPHAPSMKMYCVYGHGKDTERSYWYVYTEPSHESYPECTDPTNDTCATNVSEVRVSFLKKKQQIDWEYTELSTTPHVVNGVRMGEGDGTVSLLSLGAMCVEGWRRKRWNPAGINITTVELPHRPVPTIPRGGANTSDHVDVLGSTSVSEIILKVVTGVGHEVEENIVSNIREYAQRISWDEA